jgi:hypothetical protein
MILLENERHTDQLRARALSPVSREFSSPAFQPRIKIFSLQDRIPLDKAARDETAMEAYAYRPPKAGAPAQITICEGPAPNLL